jgi:hypothetical protein
MDGKPLEVESVVPRLGSRRIVIVLDTSGSMGQGHESNRWKFALAAVKDLVVSIPPAAPIGFIAQSTTMRKIVGFSSDTRREILTTVDLFAVDPKLPGGQTPLLTEINSAFDLLMPPQVGDQIFVITDGGDNASKETWERLSKRLSAAAVRLNAIVVSTTFLPSTPEERAGPALVQEIATATGGHVIDINPDNMRRSTAIKDGYVRAVVDVAQDQGWLVTLRMPNPPTKFKLWKLRINGDDGKPVKRVEVFYSRWWPPCTK